MAEKIQIRDRIKELRRVPASELRANPLNWRKHPKAQREALTAVLGEIGYADALIAYEPQPGAGLMLIDGHLRADATPDTTVPVLVLDVDDAEARKLLATLDPLAAMAESDADQLDAILREVQTGSEALATMLEDLAEDAGCEWAGRDGDAAEVVEDEVPEPPVEQPVEAEPAEFAGDVVFHHEDAGDRQAILVQVGDRPATPSELSEIVGRLNTTWASQSQPGGASHASPPAA